MALALLLLLLLLGGTGWWMMRPAAWLPSRPNWPARTDASRVPGDGKEPLQKEERHVNGRRHHV